MVTSIPGIESVTSFFMSSVVGGATMFRDGRNVVRMSVGPSGFFLLQDVQNGAITHLLSYLVYTGVISQD